MISTDVDYTKAGLLLEQSKGHVKSAILIALTGLDLETVQSLLDNNEGFIKKALLEWRGDQNNKP